MTTKLRTNIGEFGERSVHQKLSRRHGIDGRDINGDGQLDVFMAYNHGRCTTYIPKMIQGMSQFLAQFEEGGVCQTESLKLVSGKPIWASRLQNGFNAGTMMLMGAKDMFIARTRQDGFKTDPI